MVKTAVSAAVASNCIPPQGFVGLPGQQGQQGARGDVVGGAGGRGSLQAAP